MGRELTVDSPTDLLADHLPLAFVVAPGVPIPKIVIERREYDRERFDSGCDFLEARGPESRDRRVGVAQLIGLVGGMDDPAGLDELLRIGRGRGPVPLEDVPKVLQDT